LVISVLFDGAARQERSPGGPPRSSCHAPDQSYRRSAEGIRSKSGFLTFDLRVASRRESFFGPKTGSTTRKKGKQQLTDFSQYL